ncbi:unnamed protein product [Dracunculus medinensis]|uniref:Chromosome_seg domain-containing protein n=1 Tax=Dracunculus medinensis TaxID=318479 RepID=A0A0N4U5R6_DRAME|nr:unnamed protein product [Dracunculus medinensis]
MAKNGFYRNIIGMIVNGRCGTVMEENIYEKIENALSESGFAKTIFICVYLMKDYRKERLILSDDQNLFGYLSSSMEKEVFPYVNYDTKQCISVEMRWNNVCLHDIDSRYIESAKSKFLASRVYVSSLFLGKDIHYDEYYYLWVRDESSKSEQNDSFWLLPSITQGQKQKSLSCKINETGRTGDNYKSIMKKRRRESQRSLDSDDDDDFASGTKFRKDLNRKKPACRKNGISRNPFGREINFKKTKYRKGFDQLLSINEPFSSSSEDSENDTYIDGVKSSYGELIESAGNSSAFPFSNPNSVASNRKISSDILLLDILSVYSNLCSSVAGKGIVTECYEWKNDSPSVSKIEGFMLELSGNGSFNSPHKVFPLETFYFGNYDNGASSSLHLGLCHVEHNSNRYRIPKSGIIQGTIFDPKGAVVHIFLIPIDAADLPKSHTSIRHKTFLKSVNTSVGQNSLKCLIHLKLKLSRSNRLYLYSNMQILFAPTNNDGNIFLLSDLDKLYNAVEKSDRPTTYFSASSCL